MTPPIAGQIFERDGKRRRVVQVDHDGRYWDVLWVNPAVVAPTIRRCWCSTWDVWASKATLVQEAAK